MLVYKYGFGENIKKIFLINLNMIILYRNICVVNLKLMITIDFLE